MFYNDKACTLEMNNSKSANMDVLPYFVVNPEISTSMQDALNMVSFIDSVFSSPCLS